MIIDRTLPVLLVTTGAISLLAAWALIVERLRLLEDPTHIPICSLNATFSCGSVMTTRQASAFGVPNPLVGIAGFSIVVTIGVALLAGAHFHRWFWIGLQAGVTFGIVFVHWLMFQSIYRIEALCIFCMIVWVMTAVLFWYVTLCNLESSRATLPRWLQGVSTGMIRYLTAIPSLWLLVVAMALLYELRVRTVCSRAHVMSSAAETSGARLAPQRPVGACRVIRERPRCTRSPYYRPFGSKVRG